MTNHSTTDQPTTELPFHGIAVTVALNIDSDTILAAVPPTAEDPTSDADFANMVIETMQDPLMDARLVESITNLLTGKVSVSDVGLLGALYGDVSVIVEREDHRSCWEQMKQDIADLVRTMGEAQQFDDLMGEFIAAVDQAIAESKAAEGGA